MVSYILVGVGGLIIGWVWCYLLRDLKREQQEVALEWLREELRGWRRQDRKRARPTHDFSRN